MFLLTLLYLSLVAQVLSEDSLVPYQSYISRPDILAPSLNIRISDETALSPGYIFLSTWSDNTQNGPYIYSNDGDLIWSGHSPSYPSLKYFNFQTHNETTMSVFRGDSDHGRGKGHIALLNSSYQVTRTIESPVRGALDFHEFLLLDGNKTAVTVSLEPIQMNLGFSEGMGWVLDSVFRCIDLGKKNEVIFEWRASEHISLNESVIGPETKKRFAGMSYGNAYDYFHINSISRFQNGDFLISARHTDTIYRISGIDGSIIWRLGGSTSSASSDFQLIGFNFSAQHDARVISEEGDLITISLFDNAYNGKTSTANASSALVIKLDANLGIARLLKRFTPLNGGLAQNQGSVQVLPDGNTLVSWGLIAEFSEFDEQGERVLDVAFVDETTRVYRVRKSEWTGMPKEVEIAVHLYARDNVSNAHFWMSWNGATEVRGWAVYTSSPGTLLGRVEREGFETHLDAGQFVEGGYVEAIGKKGEVLGRSKEIQTFVPPPNMKNICGDEHCTMQVLPSKDAVQDAGRRRAAPSRTCLRLGWDMISMNMVVCFVVGLLVGRLRWSTGGLQGMRWLSKTAR